MDKSTKILIGVSSTALILSVAFLYLHKEKKVLTEKEKLALLAKKESERKVWIFEDNIFTGSDARKGKSISSLGFIGVSKPPFSFGESIEITQDSGAKYSEYNTIMKIEDIYKLNGKWVIDVDGYRVGDTPVNGGVAKSLI
jgi:hypothetical protein